MDYKKIYESIIEKANSENREKGNGIYYESHHIVPKCLGGSDTKDNKVLLTAKEHFVCHKLLTRIYLDNRGINFAFFSMTCMSNERIKRIIPSARDYKYAKSLFAENIRGCRNPMYGVSVNNLWEEKLGSEEALLKRKNRKEKISRRVTGKGNPLFGKAHSERAKSIMREKAINREVSEETKKKHSQNYKRIFGTKEKRESISKRNSGKGNPMYGRSAYDIWIEKYGLEEANRRKVEADFKRSEFWRKKRLENDGAGK